MNDGEPGLPQPGDVLAGKYRVERAIGAGGMGAVFAAVQLRTGKPVALKWLRPKVFEGRRPEALLRLIREAQAAARVRHPNVVDVYDVEEHDGQAFLVLELLEGESLRSLLRRTRLGSDEALALLVPAMRGVAAAHAQGVVHRDLKPDNLFICRDPDRPARGIPKVLDFGISKLVADTPLAEGTLTATGATLGTPHYMSLEQLQGLPADERSDVYALGVVLYECLTGQRPFESDNFSAIVVKVATETAVHPCALRPELPRALGAVVRKAMARSPEDRYPSVNALIAALAPFVAAEPDAARAPAVAAQRAGEGAGVALVAEDATATQTSFDRRAHAAAARAARPTGRGRALALASLLLLGAGGGTWWARSALREDSPGLPAARSTTAAPAPASAPAGNPAREPGKEPSAAPAAASVDPGADLPALAPAGKRRFSSGWVYLGEYDGRRWVTRYFDGWDDGLPALGARLTARGRSYVRNAIPDGAGELAGARTVIAGDAPIELLELARWEGGSYVWARVRAAW